MTHVSCLNVLALKAKWLGTQQKRPSFAVLFPAIRTMRPTQWIKNAAVLAPLVFSHQFLDGHQVLHAVGAAFCFCLVASAVYVINDLRDVADDRAHSQKKDRPIPSGDLSIGAARILLICLLGFTLAWLYFQPELTADVAAYLILNLAYTYSLKNLAVVDLIAIAAGFLLRTQVGAAAIGVEVSFWMLTTTACLALYLGAVKRLTELRQEGSPNRLSLQRYSGAALERIGLVTGACSIASYGYFSFFVQASLAGSVLPVAFAFGRYHWLTRRGHGEAPEETFLEDRPLQALTICWMVWCVSGLGLTN